MDLSISIFLCFRINHSHLTIVFATSQHIPTLLTLAPRAKMLKMIVCIDEISEETKSVLTSWGKVVGIDVKALEECMLYFYSFDMGLY